MTEPSRTSSGSLQRLLGEEFSVVVLVIDASGKVVASNPGAQALCSDGKSLVGQPLAAFFGGAERSGDADFLEEQWRTLRRDALDNWALRRLACPSAANREVHVRVERALGGAGSYLATIVRGGPAAA